MLEMEFVWRNYMNITLESHLKEISENEGNKLYSNWMVIKEELCNKLETVSSYFQHFSLHNATHSKEICNNIERFLGEERIKKLSPTDTWLLLMAFYSHDVGMALKYNDIVNTFGKDEFKEELRELINGNSIELKEAAQRILAFEKEDNDIKPIQGRALDVFRDVQLIIEEHYRRGHAKRSADYIGEFLDEKYSLVNSRMIELLKKVCLAHQEDIGNIEKLYYEENGLFQDYVHPRFVAGMLCLGDLLDMDTNRFSKYGLESASTLAEESKLHLEKHKALKHFLIKPSGIEIEIDSLSMDVHRVARDWVHWIDETIDYLTLKWSCIAPKDFGNPPKITYKKLLIKGSDLFNEYADLRFTIDQNKALELLQGANIYKDKFVCIREVIQNAVDSSLIQLWKDVDILSNKKVLEKEKACFNICKETLKCNLYEKNKMDDSKNDAIVNFWENLQIDKNNKELISNNLKKFNEYQIDVLFYIDDNGKVVIEVSDKGTGVSNKAFESMANIGTKKDKRTDREIIKFMPGWIRPSGQFGLGLQSIFLIADKFEMITKCNDESGKRILFESGRNNKGYITVEGNTINERGTKVRIYIDESKIKVSDIKINEFSLKLKPMNEWIMDFLFEKAKNNEFIGESTIIGAEHVESSMSNYFKINIGRRKKVNKYMYEEENILSNKCLFLEESLDAFTMNGKLEFHEVESKKYLNFIYFEHESRCLCKVTILSPNILCENGEKIIEDNRKFGYRSRNKLSKIYFKNIFVCFLNEIMSEELRDVFENFRVSINMLDNVADEFLEINRNSIRDDYKDEFLSTTMKILNKVFQAMCNNICINGINSKNEYLIIIYQMLRFFKIDTVEFMDDFKEIMEEYIYKERFWLDILEETEIEEREIYKNSRFSELLSDSIKSLNSEIRIGSEHKVVNKEILDHIDKSMIDEIKMEEVNISEIDLNKYFFELSTYANAVISYTLKSSKIVRLDNKFYQFVEYIPLVLSSTQVISEYDDIHLIYIFVQLTLKKEREMIAIKDYKELIIDNVIKGSLYNCIVLPFSDEHYSKVINAIVQNEVIAFDKNEFKKDIINSEYFRYLIQYISNTRNLSSIEVRQVYIRLIDRYLNLLINSDKEKDKGYKEFVKAVVNDIMEKTE